MTTKSLEFQARPIPVLLAELAALDKALQRPTIRKSMVYAIGPMKRTIKRDAPYEEGGLSRSIGHRQLSKSAGARLGLAADSVGLYVGPVRGAPIERSKALWHEHGTQKMDADPFLGPALFRHQDVMASRFYSGLTRTLDRL